ncbi:MAG: alkaline phosphatase family protein [Actinomycetota bacterium]
MSRTLIVGFDGATLDLCRRWQADGRMPSLGSIVEDGSFGALRSTLPYNSAVAWTSLSTGVSPGRHGIYDFVLPRDGEYGYRVATRADRRAPAVWNLATHAGARIAVVNIPMTFPAEPVDGVMVSGMDAPRLEARAVHPSGYLERLRRMSPGYRIVSRAHLRATRGDFEGAEHELIGAIAARGRFVAELARPRDLDLIMVNLEATDGAQHFFWQHHDAAHPRHDPAEAARFGDAIGRVYQASDRELGRIIDAYAPDTVFVVSDHGGGPTSDWVLFMNDWLAEQGFLRIAADRVSSIGRRLYDVAKRRLSVPARRRLRPLFGKALERAKGAALYGDVDWTASRAYAHMQAAVRVNLAGREPDGIVHGRDRDRVLEEITGRAAEAGLPDGAPVFAAVHRAADFYAGDAPGGPDLLMQLAPGLHVRGRNTTATPGVLRRLDELGMYLPSGVHTPIGMVAAAGSGIERGGDTGGHDILQVAPSVLAVAGIPAPPLDAPPFLFVTSGVEGSGDLAEATAERVGLDAAEEAEVLEVLRGLGYVD